MTASGPPTLRKDASANRDKLLAAANHVFARDGLGAGVGAISAEAGVGVGTFYRHFSSKETLIETLVAALTDDIVRATLAALDVPDGRGLEQSLSRLGEVLAQHRACLPRLWASPSAQLVHDLRSVVERLLRDAQDHGRVRLELVPADVSLLWWSLREVVVSTAHLAPTAWRRHLEILLAGIRPGSPLIAPPMTDAERTEIEMADRRAAW